ncbi:MAG: hypothetical protein KDD78_06535, partial [Caldilineaceae bacterium]|nr:hypothetical protein [Caldilineaceae bacterium]
MNEDRLRRAHGRLFHRGHLAAGALLALFVLLLYSRLLLTNRVLASGDILHYFYPYRAYAADAVRAMRLPLWNPFIFLGAPFLANPQSAVLYPLHWPLAWLTVTKQLYWSAAIHSWLFGFGGYLLMRRWGVRFAAALTTGLVLAGSGFFGGLIGHINQMNGATWLPWAVLVLEAGGQTSAHGRLGAPRGLSGRRDDFIRLIPSLLGFSLLVALMLLAGHTQTVYINLFGLGLWIIWPLVDPATVRAPWAAVQRVLPQLLLYVG